MMIGEEKLATISQSGVFVFGEMDFVRGSFGFPGHER